MNSATSLAHFLPKPQTSEAYLCDVQAVAYFCEKVCSSNCDCNYSGSATIRVNYLNYNIISVS